MTNAEIVRRFLTEGYENKNYRAVMACLADGCIDHSPAGARGNAQAVDILKLVEAQLSGLTIRLPSLFCEGDMVAARILFDGLHTGVCMGVPATGKRLRFEALEHFRVVDGRIVESWGYWPDKDIEARLRQASPDQAEEAPSDL